MRAKDAALPHRIVGDDRRTNYILDSLSSVAAPDKKMLAEEAVQMK